ncbi:MAG: cupin domain-containing protein [Clostridia bacterium]|nr:cupin domain-containing protein [Clostridia bacterium]
MIVGRAKDVEGIHVGGKENILKKVLISPEKGGWQDYVMRLFELSPGGDSCTPRHTHDWPHIIYIVSGTGVIHLEGTDHEVETGSFAFIPGGKLHQLINTGSEKFSFICIVPPEGDV